MRTPRHIEAAGVPPEVPRCANCGRPLENLPRFLHSNRGAAHGFQCQRCFYAPKAGRLPPSPAVVASPRTRWITEALTEGLATAAPRTEEG